MKTTDHGEATDKLYHLRLQVECTFCNLKSRARNHAVLVIDLYELLGNPIAYLIEPPMPYNYNEVEHIQLINIFFNTTTPHFTGSTVVVIV